MDDLPALSDAERERCGELLHRITLGTATVAGDAFYRRLVESLALTLDVSTCFVTECVDQSRVEVCTLAFYHKGGFQDRYCYDVNGTPCEPVLRGHFKTYPEELMSLWPDDAMLTDIGAVSYTGAPAIDRHGTVLGHLAIFDERPRTIRPHEEWIMRIFASRAAAEMGRDDAIAQRRLAEEQSRQAGRLATFQGYALGVAHDLNNLFAAILGYADIVRSALPEDSRLDRQMGSLTQAVERATQVSDQLLTLGRTGVHADRQPVNLGEVVREALRIVEGRADTGIELTQTHAATVMLVADETELVRAVVNVLTNAVQAMPDGGELNVSVESSADEAPSLITGTLPQGRYGIVRIADTGVGMEPSELEHIFDPFFSSRGDPARHGLGLAEVRAVVDSHGGGIDVHSLPGAGTTITLLFPIADED